MTPEIIEKLKGLTKEFKIAWQGLSLFVLVRREDTDLWDIIIGGDKIDNQDNLEWSIGLVNKKLSKAEIVIFSRLILLDNANLFVTNLINTFGVAEPENVVQLRNVRIGDISLADSYLFYSKHL